METKRFAGYDLSRMMLGTVQFGMPYGVANRTGQPTYRDVLDMITAAVDGGVNCFDTAAAYGTSEEVLGRALRELKLLDRVIVVTKVRVLSPEVLADAARTAEAIEQSVAESRQRLGLECLPIVLFHRETDGVHLGVLERLKARGWLKHAGVSCDNRPGLARDLVAGGRAAALQLPGNVLDRRHQATGVFREAAARGVAVFIRSVYLQGLLLMPEDVIPAALQEVVPVRRRLAAIAREGGMTLAELALRYMLAQEGVTCVLTGVETVAQVRENVALFERGPLSAGMVKTVDAAVTALPELVLTPGQWPNDKYKAHQKQQAQSAH
jgi:aryl-alcohol dehydrogenase-like predicted oxidoreductase